MTESGRWHARDVTYYEGAWDDLCELVPRFELMDFRVGLGNAPNPNLRTVVRLPLASGESPVPVGTVSPGYSLVQHHEVAAKCLDGIVAADIEPGDLRCELGLTPLGEFMNLRVYFPESYRYAAAPQDDDVMELRLECFNAVDGTAPLTLMFGWLRQVCTNGLVIGEAVVERRSIHNRHLSLDPLPDLVKNGIKRAATDIERLDRWKRAPLPGRAIVSWIDGPVASAWGPVAACRVFHICRNGRDVEAAAFESARPTAKRVVETAVVPGAAVPARTLFDAAQALTWVAGQRRDRDERLQWHREVDGLVETLASYGAASESPAARG